jgi:hypothetical protein
MLRSFFELLLLGVVDIRPLALGEAVHEERLGSPPENHNGPVAFRFPLTGSGDPLLNNAAAQVGVDLAPFGAGDSLAQNCIRDPSFLAKR